MFQDVFGQSRLKGAQMAVTAPGCVARAGAE